MNDNNIVSSYSLFATLVVTIIGVNVFSYPSELANIVGGDGWIVILLSSIISYFLIYVICKVIRNNDYAHTYEILQNNLGKIFGGLATLSLILYSIFFLSTGLRVFTEEIKMYLLERTPTEFIFLVTILTGSYLVRAELDSLIKFNEISFWLMFIPVIVVFIFSFYDADITNLLPVLNNAPESYLKGIMRSMNRFMGFQILFLILPFVKEKRNIKRIVFNGIIFIALFYVLVFILAVGIFGKEQTKILLWPTITMIKYIDIPGAFIERWEGIIMSIWIIFYFTTFTNHYYFASDLLRKVLNFKDIKLASSIILPFIYLVAIYPKNIAQVYALTERYNSLFFLINLVILPLALLFISSAKKGGRNVR
ncbi:spore germination protein AB [Clostridium tetanomorphum]|uniref:GerAB/ArcD/ProY family transporter n=1 Tax=Clostridium tetanomorphum TaxID=1553 RepID=UPI000445A17A|nr:endospore germination permease [Clostridium tetanomorphum]KAJ48898.1 spore germination protein A2 [Clostridium tetanomorphum DSM 665]KAJ53290.1 spore germination protein A2 [Clostridium tetanomorphum DSM 665]MBP1865678.1 spore germination protein AB [Clostridium tetanomorphum]NRS86798.1 spore germination protein AB [Clostridium tetanomorphum]SQC00405.1 spore germination protein A2 [Clostridium tetanomorphum]